MPKRPREHALEEESRRFCRDLFPPHMVVRDKGDDYGIDLEVEDFDKNGLATGLIFYVQLKGTDSTDKKTQREVRVPAEKFNYWLELDCPTVIMRYCSNEGKPHVYWLLNYEHSARQTKKGSNYVYEFNEENCWSEESLKSLLEEVNNDRLVNSSSLKLPITLQFNEHARKTLLPQGQPNPFLNYSHFVRVGQRLPNRVTVNIEASEKLWSVRLGRRNRFTFLFEEESPEKFASNLILTAAVCLYLRGQSSILSRTASKCFQTAEVVSDKQLCGFIAKALLENGKLSELSEIWQTAVKRGLTIEPFKALLFIPVTNADLIEADQLLEQLENYIHLAEYSKNSNPEIQSLIQYAKGSFEVTLKKQEDALKSFSTALKLDTQVSHYPLLWSQTANIYFWKNQWEAAAFYYLFTLKLQGERHWETKANFADTQWRRGRLGSSLFWLGRVISEQDAAADPRFGWFCFLEAAVRWFREFSGNSRFTYDPDGVSRHLDKIDEEQQKLNLEDLTRLIQQDLSNIDLWERMVDQAEVTKPEISIFFEMMATACDYSNIARWASLVIRATCDSRVAQEYKLIIIQAALSMHPDGIAAGIRTCTESDYFNIPADILHKLADQFEAIPRKELSRYIRPVEDF